MVSISVWDGGAGFLRRLGPADSGVFGKPGIPGRCGSREERDCPSLLLGPNGGKDGWIAEIGVAVRQFAAELLVEHFDLPTLRIEHRAVMVFAVLIMRGVRKTWRAKGIW